MFSQMGDRLQRELTSLCPSGTNVKVIAPPQRQNLAWLGGSDLASLSSFQKTCMSKEEYDEHGKWIDK